MMIRLASVNGSRRFAGAAAALLGAMCASLPGDVGRASSDEQRDGFSRAHAEAHARVAGMLAA
jgi:hypothetical protein